MKISKELLKGSTAILILKVISEGDAYGYQIVGELKKRSGDVFKLNEGTLYPILHTLEKEGYVKSYRKSTEGGRERRYYKITLEGKAQLSEKIEEWNLFAEGVNRVLKEER
ncbi:MAG: helix-turn-helix transcriptional regulator [Clostridia bacterium]|nr:helix-turn-helix transcriptional regulator [Clostridia bacterium]